jgi:polygalacturonase
MATIGQGFSRAAFVACAVVIGQGCGSGAAGDGGAPVAPGSGANDASSVSGDDAGPNMPVDSGPGAPLPVDGSAPDRGSPSDSGRGGTDAPATDAGRAADAGGAADGGRSADSGAETGAHAGADAAGADGGDPCGPGNPAVVPLPIIGPATLNVVTSGAVGDGTTDDTAAIQAALTAAAAAGGGLVTVPAGTFLSGPIVLGSGTRLDLAQGAVLKMLPMSRWPAATPFITANNAHDLAITGAGTIEGQGQDWWNALTATPTLTRPQEVDLTNSTRVQISGIRLQNPPEEHIWVKGDTDVTITGITIETLAVTGQHFPNNTDGVDIGASGVFFCGNSITCGDDNVVMGGSNIYVAYSSFGVGHGCTIGSITDKGVSGVTVDHVTFDGTTSGIRMKSERGRGGLVQNLSYSNITMTNVQNPVFITSYYPTLPTDPRTDPAQAVTATTPEWQNITIANLTAVGSTAAGILWGLPEAQIANVVFDNVSIQATQAMEIFHATGVSFVNGSKVTVTPASAVVTFDAAVTGIATRPYP